MEKLLNRTGWIVAMPIVGAAIFYVLNFADLFLLIEYRQWVGLQNTSLAGNLSWFFENAILHSDWRGASFPRSTSLVGVSMFSSVCGSNAGCHNLFHIGLLLAAAAFMGALLMQQTRGGHSALIATAVLFFLFSAPILDAVAWQATVLDKFSVFLSAAFIWYVARIRVAPGLGWRLADQAILLVMTIVTMNAKEAAWSIIPSLVLLAAVQHADTKSLISSIGRSCARFGLSIVYMGIHVGLVMANRLLVHTGEAARVMSGSALDNLRVFAGYLFNRTPYSASGLVLVVLLLVSAVLLAAWIAPSRQTRLLLLWAALSFIAAMAIPLRTAGQSPFYLVVPAYYLAILLFWIMAAMADSLTWRPAQIVGTVVLSLAMAMNLAGFADGTASYFARTEMSRNFQRSLKEVATEFSRDKSAAVTFYYPPTQTLAYMFLGETGPDSHSLAQYIEAAGASQNEIRALEKKIHDAPLPNDGPAVPAPNEIAVYLRSDLSLAELRHNPAK